MKMKYLRRKGREGGRKDLESGEYLRKFGSKWRWILTGGWPPILAKVSPRAILAKENNTMDHAMSIYKGKFIISANGLKAPWCVIICNWFSCLIFSLNVFNILQTKFSCIISVICFAPIKTKVRHPSVFFLRISI